MKKIATIGAIILLCFQLISQIYLAKTNSQTTDEAVHLSAGYTYLTRHDFRFNPEHPVLAKMITAVPLLFVKPNIPADDLYWSKASNFFYDSWVENRFFGEQMLYGLGNNADNLLFLGRLPMILLTLLLGLAIFVISSKYWGWGGGLISLALYTLDPNFTAHGHLVTTDIAISLGYLLTIYLFLKFLKEPDWKNTLYTGLALGFSQLVKFTAVILYPVMLFLLAYYLVTNRIKIWSKIRPYLKVFIILIVTWLIIWAGYGFSHKLSPKTDSLINDLKYTNEASQLGITKMESDFNVTPKSQEEIDQKSSVLAPANKAYSFARYILIPRDYFKGLMMVLTHVGGGHTSFLLGMTSNQGWWYYFPVLFFAKTPIFTLAIFATSIYYFVLSKKRKLEPTYFAIAAVLILAIAMISRADLGLRHIFPIYPLLFVISGGLYTIKDKWIKVITWIALIGLLFEFWLTSPHFLSYYNEFAGGTSNGYNIAVDSNYDWGQDLKRVKSYIDSHDLQNVWVEYGWNGQSSLEYYMIDSLPLESLNENSKGYLIIGASGLPSPKYQWLKKYKYYDRITPGVFVYYMN